MEKEEEELIKAIRQNTKTGRPCGGEGFISKIEELLGRRLKVLQRGRPRSKK